MNKKILFLIFITILILPNAVFAEITPLVSTMFDNVAELAMYIGGAIVVIGWVIAGILYLTAAGGERLAVAKKALIAAVIGTVLVVFATGGYDVIKNIIENILNAGK
ncbi:MAG: hypothetical protein WC613_04500 [Candidatus Aenigmatarchaeota archaeon]